MGLNMDARKRGCIRSAPAFQQQAGLVREISAAFGNRRLGGSTRLRRWMVQTSLGQQKVTISVWAPIEGKLTGNVTFRRELSHRVTVQLDFDHGGCGLLLEVLTVAVRQVDRGQHPVVQGRCHKLVLLLLNLGKQ